MNTLNSFLYSPHLCLSHVYICLSFIPTPSLFHALPTHLSFFMFLCLCILYVFIFVDVCFYPSAHHALSLKHDP